MANKTAAQLQDLGLEVGDSYLLDSVPLDVGVTKVAQNHDLEPEEIRRVCEFANQGVYAALWKQAEKKTIEFDRADPEHVLEKLNAVASPARRFHKAARLTPKAKPEPDLMKVAEKRVESFAEAGTPRQRYESLYAAGKVAQQRGREAVLELRAEKLAAEVRVVEGVRDLLVEAVEAAGGVGSRRGAEALAKTASEVVAAVKAQRPEMVKRAARLVTAAVKTVDPRFELDIDGLAKITKTAAPVEGHRIAAFLSTPDMPVAIINGNHRILMDLEVIKKCDTDLSAFGYNLVTVDDDVRYVAKKVRESSGLPAGSVS